MAKCERPDRLFGMGKVMYRFKGSELASWCGGAWHGGVPGEINGICHDTRSLEPGDIYIAIKGDRFDGHEFVSDELAKGACGVVVERAACSVERSDSLEGEALLVVEDTRKALADMAVGYRKTVAPLMIGITGSAGKTTVKEMAAQALSTTHKTARTKGNWNNDIGVPMSLLTMSPDAEIGVFEVGMNHPGEIASLCRLLEPSWGLVTNVAASHIESFDSVEDIAREKMAILESLPADGTAVLSADDDFFEMLQSAAPGRVVTVSTEAEADYWAHPGSPLLIHERDTGEETPLLLPVPGRHNIQNVLFAAAVARGQSVAWNDICTALEHTRPLSMRWEESCVAERVVINDAYNANPLSMRAAIEAFCESVPGKKLWLVLGDMLELGKTAEQEHVMLGEFIARQPWHGLVTVGDQAQLIAQGMKEATGADRAVHRCKDHIEAARCLARETGPGDALLLKASRGMAFEKILQVLTTELRV